MLEKAQLNLVQSDGEVALSDLFPHFPVTELSCTKALDRCLFCTEYHSIYIKLEALSLNLQLFPVATLKSQQRVEEITAANHSPVSCCSRMQAWSHTLRREKEYWCV